MTMNELTEYVREKALQYLADTGETVDSFPLSIVDFVIESAISECHFPTHFTEERKVSDLNKVVNKMAMACVDVYAKVGAEGQIAHTENGVARQYESAWISKTLFSSLPNYITVM